MNILVLGMGSNVSQGIVKALRSIDDLSIRITGACISKSSVGLYMCDKALISPLARDNAFLSWYIKTCRDNSIDMTFTGVEEIIDVLVRNRDYIEAECDTKFAYPEKKAWEIGLDKYRTCQWLKDHGIPYPDFALASDSSEVDRLIERAGFPLIVKPRKGKSSKGIWQIKSVNDLKEIPRDEDYVIQECIGDEDNEYTVGCYFNKNRKLQSTMTMHRYLKNGSTSMAEIVNDEKIDQVIDHISENLPMTGPVNFQLRYRKDGTPVCFEWNVRYSGTTAIRNHFGFGDVEAAIREYLLGSPIGQCFTNADCGVALRVEDEIYIEHKSFNDLFLENNL